MKKLICLAAALLMAVSFAACQPGGEEAKSPVVADVAAKLAAEIKFPEMASQEAASLQYYGFDEIDTSNIEELSYQIASSGLTPEEVLIIKMKDDSQIADIKTMMETRRDKIAATAADYTPELVNQLDTAVIGTSGVYAYMAITPDNKKAREIIDEMF